MLKILPIAIALAIIPAFLEPAEAIPSVVQRLSVPSQVEPAYYRGPRGRVYARPYHRVYARPYGRVYAHGPYRVGRRYYGGVWYGHVRRWYGGRWWPYGVGRCWAPSPIGYVWVCG